MSAESPTFDGTVDELGDLYDVDPQKVIGQDHWSNTEKLNSAMNYLIDPGANALWRRIRDHELHGVGHAISPRTELGNLACVYARHLQIGNPRVSTSDSTCAVSEVHLLESLIMAEDQAPEPGYKSRSTIFVDKDRMPLAFKKSHGAHTTYVLRQAPAYLPLIPEGTIVNSYYGSNLPFLGSKPANPTPAKNNPQIQLAVVDVPHGLAVVRPSIYMLSPEFLDAVSYDLQETVLEELEDIAHEAAGSSLASIIKRVDNIAASAKT